MRVTPVVIRDPTYVGNGITEQFSFDIKFTLQCDASFVDIDPVTTATDSDLYWDSSETSNVKEYALAVHSDSNDSNCILSYRLEQVGYKLATGGTDDYDPDLLDFVDTGSVLQLRFKTDDSA